MEHAFTCPYCWQEITILVDASTPQQSYVEDCEKCCHPILLTIEVEQEEISNFTAEKAQ